MLRQKGLTGVQQIYAALDQGVGSPILKFVPAVCCSNLLRQARIFGGLLELVDLIKDKVGLVASASLLLIPVETFRSNGESVDLLGVF